MKEGGTGGGNTITGLRFEGRVDLVTMIKKITGYSCCPIGGKAGTGIFYDGKLVARCFKKHAFYDYLRENNIDYTKIVSCKLLPDDALLVIIRETLFIIEVKYQEVPGSVDEKLQTCDFKRKQYMKLVRPLNLKVEYVYVLNDYFKAPRYHDVLEYIESVCCHYKFNELPLSWLGLPPFDRAVQ